MSKDISIFLIILLVILLSFSFAVNTLISNENNFELGIGHWWIVTKGMYRLLLGDTSGFDDNVQNQ